MNKLNLFEQREYLAKKTPELLYEQLDNEHGSELLIEIARLLKKYGLLHKKIHHDLMSLTPLTQELSTPPSIKTLLLLLLADAIQQEPEQSWGNKEQNGVLQYLKLQLNLIELQENKKHAVHLLLTNEDEKLQEFIGTEPSAHRYVGMWAESHLAKKNAGSKKGTRTREIVIQQWEKFTGNKATAATFANSFCEIDSTGKVIAFIDVVTKEKLECKVVSEKTVRLYVNEHMEIQKTPSKK